MRFAILKLSILLLLPSLKGVAQLSSGLITVVSPSVGADSISANSLFLCPGDSVMLTAHGGLLTGGYWAWYESNSGSGPAVATGTTASFLPYEATNYYVRAEGGCYTAAFREITIGLDSTGCTGGRADWMLAFRVNLYQGSKGWLEWKTTGDSIVKYFVVEESPDSTHFTRLGTVPASSNDAVVYHFIDEMLQPGMNYYRIRPVLMEGNSVYSQIESLQLKMGGMNQVNIYPNPVRSKLTMEFFCEREGELSVWALTMLSQTVFEKKHIHVYPGQNNISLDLSNLADGPYFLRYHLDKSAEAGGLKFIKMAP